MIKSKTLGSAAGIQYQGVIDKSESIGVQSLSNAVIIGRFRRGRMDKPFKVTIDNYKALLGREPSNPSYMAVNDAFERGVSTVYVLRVGNKTEDYMMLINDAYRNAVSDGFSGTQKAWLDSLVGRDGANAYDIAVLDGFLGTQAEWLDSLDGKDGLSAYDIAVSNGYQGTLQQWIAFISVEHTKVVGAFGVSTDDAVSQKFMTDTIDQTIGDIAALLDLVNGEQPAP